MENLQKTQDEIKEFVKSKMGNKKYMLSILVDMESAKPTESVREIKVIYDSNINPQTQPFNEINSFVIALDRLGRSVREQIIPKLPKIQIK